VIVPLVFIDSKLYGLGSQGFQYSVVHHVYVTKVSNAEYELDPNATDCAMQTGMTRYTVQLGDHELASGD
jgi:hypothetical protein